MERNMVEIYSELEKFNTRWNIKINDEEKFSTLKNRVNVCLQNILGQLIYSQDIEYELLTVKGSAEIPRNTPSIVTAGILFGKESNVIKELLNSKTEIDFFRNLQVLFLSSYIGDSLKEELGYEINNIIKASGYSNIVFIKKEENKFLIYPVGEKVLDEEIVNKTIEGLENYKTAYEIFIDSLEKYSNSENTGVENVQIINSLRTALENYLKEKFKTDSRSIENIATKVVGPYLAEKNIDVNIRNMYINLAKSIEKFNNDNIKHTANLKISKEEVELFIYLTGALVRFLESLK
ncbi:hypothetical protein DWZ20_13315 [Clostridium perfringens]|uniref:hypothetical protein n=1 Tax=Clostridium perfringens TaxID=1502 RepID=UPI000E469601|nr:hypothetical protein [Clostridium perfringens]RHN23810.1 hypothetical protein DWZ20_13315 [Clostridium perfringens]